MLLPDNIHPKQCFFYIGSLILGEFQHCESYDIVELYNIIKTKYGVELNAFILCMDWLYLIGILIVDNEGNVNKCI